MAPSTPKNAQGPPAEVLMWLMLKGLLVGVKTLLTGMSSVYWASAAPMKVTATVGAWRAEMGVALTRVAMSGTRAKRALVKETIFVLEGGVVVRYARLGVSSSVFDR